MLLGGFGCSSIVGVDNVLARSWTWLSTSTPPVWLDDRFVAAEAMVFAVVVAGLVYAVVRQGVRTPLAPPSAGPGRPPSADEPGSTGARTTGRDLASRSLRAGVLVHVDSRYAPGCVCKAAIGPAVPPE